MDKQKQIFNLRQRRFDYILQKTLLHPMETGLYPNRASIYIKRKLCLYETKALFLINRASVFKRQRSLHFVCTNKYKTPLF